MFKKKEFAVDADNMNEITEREEGHKTEKSKKAVDSETLVKEWQRDAEQLKILVPEFDLAEAIKNKAFADALTNGATVFEAYKTMSTPPKSQPREEIFQNARSARKGTGGAAVNPAKLSDSEFRKYIENIKNS